MSSEIKFHKYQTNITGILMSTNTNFLLCLAHFFLEMKDISDKVLEEIKTHIFYSITFFSQKIVSFMR